MRRAREIAIASALAVALAATACSLSTAPADNVEFATLTDLHQLDGRYRNRGIGASDSQYTYFLSAILFPGEPPLDHESIESIDVRATDTRSITVQALDSMNAVIRQVDFVEGRDFALAAGRLRIHRHGALLSQAVDDPLVGPRVETVELGLDLRGAGKYRSTFTGAGLVWLLVPVAVHAADDVRFERIEE